MAELEQHGIWVVWVDNGRDGLVKAVGPGYDAITLDRMLAGVDGLASVTTMRQVGIESPVLMISALSDIDERVRGLRAGGDDYMTKPFRSEEHTSELQSLMRISYAVFCLKKKNNYTNNNN